MPPLPEADLAYVLEQSAEVWPEFRDARLFVTGGTGFFGRWLLESLCRANQILGLKAEAHVLTRDPAAFAARAPHLAGAAGLHFQAGDVRTFDFPRQRFTHVIHAATATTGQLDVYEPETMLEVIVDGTRRVLDLARQCGARRMLFTSSGAIYGRQPPALSHIDEDFTGGPAPLNVAGVYAEGKRLAELWCALAHQRHGLHVIVARAFAFLGPLLPLDAHFAAGNFLRDGLHGGPIRVGGDGTPYRSYLYAADLAVWLWTLLARGQAARAYNVGSEEAVSIAELARKVAAYFQTEVHIARTPDPNRPPDRYVPSARRAREELGLRAGIGLDEAIDRTARWHRRA